APRSSSWSPSPARASRRSPWASSVSPTARASAASCTTTTCTSPCAPARSTRRTASWCSPCPRRSTTWNACSAEPFPTRTAVNFRAVLGILGFLLLIIGALMLPSLAFASWGGDGDARALLAAAAVTIGTGAALWLGFKGHRAGLGKREGFLVAASGWAVASLFGCLPFLFSGASPSFTDAYFETMSGFTTTGASILADIEAVPRGLLFWRATTHWIGGMGILLLSIAILPLLGVGGMQLFNAEVSHVTLEKLTPRISQTARLLWLLYCGMTVAHALLLIAGGMSAFDAIAHAFSTVSSGGFSTRNASLGHYGSAFIEGVTMFFMFAT